MGSARIIYLVTEDWYFISHRLPMARAARDAGYEVHVATRVADHAAAIRREGFTLHPLDWERGSTNPFHLLSAVRDVRRLYRSVRPDLAHHVALQPTVVGSLAAFGLPIVRLNALAGLGYAFISRSIKARALRLVLRPLLRWLLGSARAAVLVQNPNDRALIESLGVGSDRITLIPGSGVDVDAHTPLPEPPEPVTVGFVGRLLYDKGVNALVEAHGLLARRGRPIRLLLAGDPDPSNPASIPPEEIARWSGSADIKALGHVNDVRTVWAASHIAALPSRREGLPKSLLEAAACGRPIVATDVPGCREIARAGVNALLVPWNDAAALADAIEKLAADPDLRRRFGEAGRRIVETEFSDARIGRDVVALYSRLLGRTAHPATIATGGSPR